MMLATLALFCQLAEISCEPFRAPGYPAPVAGAWYTSESPAVSGMPLGGLGTGYVDLKSNGTFGDAVLENNWLAPRAVDELCGWTIKAGDKALTLFQGSEGARAMRFWGHYPMADMDYGATFDPVKVYARAFTPVIPHEYTKSNLPLALFRYQIRNTAATPVPVEISLQWRLASDGLGSQGNVEGALGWRLDALQPGKTWRVAPTLLFMKDVQDLVQRAAEARFPTTLLGVMEGGSQTFSAGDVSPFALDAAGGFDWEKGRKETGVFDGKPHIGQMYWQLACGDIRAGRGPEGAYGLDGASLPAKTAAGDIGVTLQVYKAGKDALALVYEFKNLTRKPLENLHFGFALNADINGPAHAEEQRAAVNPAQKALVFTTSGDGLAVVLTGDASHYITGTYPAAHERMQRDEWSSFDAPAKAAEVRSFPDGIQIGGSDGSYAVGADADGWQMEALHTGDGVIRATVAKTFAPGEKAAATFALAWHFPYWTSSDGERLRHRYAMEYKDAGEVLAAHILDAAELEKRIIRWQAAVYAARVSPLLKDALINSLYFWPRNSWWLADGRFFQSESFTGCPITETFVCRFNGSFPLALLFPECERATMMSIAAAQTEAGEIPFAFGRPAASRSPYYQVQHPIVSPEFILTTWRNYALWRRHHPTQAHEYLRAMYPRVQQAFRYALTLDKDGDGLINEDPGSAKGFPANQYYDIWPWWGTSAYTGSIWLAALNAAAEFARIQSDPAFAREVQAVQDTARPAFEKLLWTGSYYRLYNWPAKKRISETSLTNALCGQWFAYASGLGEIVPKANVLSVIDTVLNRNAAATKFGAVNGVKPDGKPDTTFSDHSAVITIGEVWNFCAMAASAGRVKEAANLFETSYANILLTQRTPWNIPWSLDAKTGAIKWGINYYSNPCVWTLLRALDTKSYEDLGHN